MNGKNTDRILVILTGGTIGSRIDGKIIDTSEASACQLIARYREKYGEEEQFEVIQPFCVLSENMGPGLWEQLGNLVWERLQGGYKGIIIAHGSDTLSYTAAYLGMLLRHASVPVFLIASNYALGERGSNGLANFRSAVKLIEGSCLKGVYVVYQDEAGSRNVYLATRLLEADPYRDQFRSFGGPPLGKEEEGIFIPCPDRINPAMDKLVENRERIAIQPPRLKKNILMLQAYPGMDPENIRIRNAAAVLCILYHSGTGCAAGEGSLIKLIRRCKDKGIRVYTASHKGGENLYSTTRQLLEEGIIPLKNISPQSAYGKLLLLYNLGKQDRIEENLFFERLPAPLHP